MYRTRRCDYISRLRWRPTSSDVFAVGYALREMPRIAAVLRDFPDAHVVISSTWRVKRSLQDLQALFPPDVAMRVIGVMPTWQDLADTAYSGERDQSFRGT